MLEFGTLNIKILKLFFLKKNNYACGKEKFFLKLEL